MNKYLIVRHYEDDMIGVATNCTTNRLDAVFTNGRYDANSSSEVATWNFLRDTLLNF